MDNSRGLATKYKGTLYRSRLEARWAAFFTHMGWAFRYEPFYLPGYLPDFLIAGPRKDSCLIEVKPAVEEEDYRSAVSKVQTALQRGNSKYDLIIVGVTPIVKPFYDYPNAFGLLGLREDNWQPFKPWSINWDYDVQIKYAWECAKREINWYLA